MGDGGFSAQYLNTSLTVGEVYDVSILETRDRFYLKDIPVQLSWVTDIEGSPGSIKAQMAGVQFLDLSGRQNAQIRYLLDWHDAEAKGDLL